MLYRFLLKVGGVCLYNIFKVEIRYHVSHCISCNIVANKLSCSMGLLGEFILALNEEFQESDAVEVISILDQLSRTSRFNLSVKFLSQKEQQAVSHIYFPGILA